MVANNELVNGYAFTLGCQLLSQSADTPTELLLALPDEELVPESRERIAPYLEQVLSPDVLRENAVDPDDQLALARAIDDDPKRWSGALSWNGFPTYDQLEPASELLWNHFGSARRWGVRSPSQLTQLALMAQNHTLRELIANQVKFRRSRGETVDLAVLDVLTFYRSGLTFGFPKYLRVLDRIQRDVLARYGLPFGNFRQYAGAAEAAFQSPLLMALDEYGIPLELGRRLASHLLRGDPTFDDVLARLRRIDPQQLQGFEAELLKETQRSL
jgi:hypothetical protein